MCWKKMLSLKWEQTGKAIVRSASFVQYGFHVLFPKRMNKTGDTDSKKSYKYRGSSIVFKELRIMLLKSNTAVLNCKNIFHFNE